jgi:hypothetical protein
MADRHALQQQHEKAKIVAESCELDRQFSALDDEESELQRRLASGELSSEEAAEVRARLAAIAQERTMLGHQQNQNVFAEQHVQINTQLSALDDEEAELHRKLAAGELSPEEESAIRKRLEEIENERTKLRQKQLGLYREEEEAALQLATSGVLSEHEVKRVQNRINALLAIQHGLSDKTEGLSPEEEELIQQLANGKLTPEEAADARARLAALRAERQAAAQENKSKQARVEERQQLVEKLDEINTQLSALDDEEAKLRRKLAAGELSPGEEAAIRRRLGEIELAKTGLMAERAAISALQDAMDASELAAAEEKRQHQLARKRKRERARRNRNHCRQQNLFSTINFDPKQGFHEEASAPTMRFHGVGQPKVQSVQQASERLEPLRQALGETLQPAALVEGLSAKSTRDYRNGRMDWNQTMAVPADALSGNTEGSSVASASALVPLQFTGSDEEEVSVAPVLVRSRTLEAKDRATKSSLTTTRALVEALDEVAVVRCPVVPSNSMGSLSGTGRLPPVRSSPIAGDAVVQFSGLVSDQARRRRQRRRERQTPVSPGAPLARSGRVHGCGSFSALPAKSMRADHDGSSTSTYIGQGAAMVSRSQSIKTLHSFKSKSGRAVGNGDGVDLGRNGLPVSLARALAMRAQADAPDARLELGQVVTRDMHPRVQRQQLRLRLGTAVRGRRLAS